MERSSGRIAATPNSHRSDWKRFVVRADEKLTAFIGLESAIGGLARRGAANFSPHCFSCFLYDKWNQGERSHAIKPPPSEYACGR
jgi:hypothetical protein